MDCRPLPSHAHIHACVHVCMHGCKHGRMAVHMHAPSAALARAAEALARDVADLLMLPRGGTLLPLSGVLLEPPNLLLLFEVEAGKFIVHVPPYTSQGEQAAC
eukprot:365327-Chlamydomonas_euryale.AAC.9